MISAIKCKLYPKKEQLALIRKTAGCRRFVYNYFLNIRTEAYEKDGVHLSGNNCNKLLTKLKNTPDHKWLYEVPNVCLQQANRDLDKAFKLFFKGFDKKEPPKKKFGYPKKASRYGVQSFRFTNSLGTDVVICGKNKIKLPVIGKIKCRGLKQFDKYESYKITSATVSTSPDGYCEISILIQNCELKSPIILPQTGKVIGIDMGVKNTLTFSDGTKIDKPLILKELYEKKEFYTSKRSTSLKPKGDFRGSNNYRKWNSKLQRISRKIQNIEDGFCKNKSYNLVKKYDIVCMEDLDVKDMFVEKTDDGITCNKSVHNINRSLAQSCMGKLKVFIEYFAEKYGKELCKVDRYFASSQICHKCGYINENTKDLTVREWKCPNCGVVHDRDVNAALNILEEGLKNRSKKVAGKHTTFPRT